MTGRRGALAVVAGAATWGTTGTAQALADVAASPLAVGAARTVAGAGVLALVAVATRHRSEEAAARLPRGPLLVAGAAIALYQVAFFLGVATTGVAVGTVVGIGSVPVLTGLVAWVADGTRPSRRWWGATALAVLGAALVVGGAGAATVVVPAGVALALGAGLAYAVLTVASRRLLDTGRSPTGVMAAVFAVGAVPSVVVLMVADGASLVTGRGVLLVTWLAAVTVGVGYVLYARGLRTLPPATVGTLTLTEPLVAALLGLLVLAERPGPLPALGMAMLATGLLIMTARQPSVATRPR